LAAWRCARCCTGRLRALWRRVRRAPAAAAPGARDADLPPARGAAAQVKQSWHLTDKAFVATSNSRNENMLREAGDFAGHLKRCEKEIRTLKNATEGAPVARAPRQGPRARRAQAGPGPLPEATARAPLTGARAARRGAGLLGATKLVMTAPLPRVYEEGPGGKAVPQGPAPGQPSNIGGEFRVEELLRISKETVRAARAQP